MSNLEKWMWAHAVYLLISLQKAVWHRHNVDFALIARM